MANAHMFPINGAILGPSDVYSFVQSGVNQNIGGSASTIATSAMNTTAGRLLVVAVVTRDNSGHAPVVSDTAGNRYYYAGTIGGTDSIYVYYCPSCLGHATNVVTATAKNASIVNAINVREYISTAGVSLLDIVEVAAPSGTTNAVTDSYTPHAAAELTVMFAGNNAGSDYTAGTGMANKSGTGWLAGCDKVNSGSAAAQTASMTSAGSANHRIIAVTFTASGLLNSQAFGDSITFGTGVTEAQRWANLVSENKTWMPTNFATAATQLADIGFINATFNTPITSSSKILSIAGTNDMRLYGGTAGNKDDFKYGYKAMCAWLAMPDANKHDFSDASFTGTWTTNAREWIRQGYKSTTTAGDYAEFTVSGTSVIICLARFSSGGGDFSVDVNGIPVALGITSVMTSATNAGRAVQPTLYVVSGLSSGSHTVRVTATSGKLGLVWYAGHDGSDLGARVYIHGTPRLATSPLDYYTAAGYAPFTNGSNTHADAYATIMSDVATELTAIGLSVTYCRSTLTQDTSTDFQTDGVHPSVAGNTKIRDAVLAII